MTCFVNCALFRTLEAKPHHRAVRSISLHETLTDHVSKAEWWVAMFHAGIRLRPRLVVVGQAYTLMLVSWHNRKTEQTNRKRHADMHAYRGRCSFQKLEIMKLIGNGLSMFASLYVSSCYSFPIFLSWHDTIIASEILELYGSSYLSFQFHLSILLSVYLSVC